MRRRVTIRLSDDELEFVEEMKKKGIAPSTLIRFCLDFFIFIKDHKDFKKFVDKLLKKELSDKNI
jgi:hypothetical protein